MCRIDAIPPESSCQWHMCSTLMGLVPNSSGNDVPLNIIYQGTETTVEEDATALIGSDATAAVRIVRPGISRRHAVASFDGTTWKVEDAGSRNGTFAEGQRVQTTVITGPTTLYLGHPSDGEAISFVPLAPVKATAEGSIQEEINEFVIAEEPARPRPDPRPIAVTSTRNPEAPAVNSTDAEFAALTAALRDQISSVKGLTWSVWAMIAVTAVLAVMTLFVGILGS